MFKIRHKISQDKLFHDRLAEAMSNWRQPARGGIEKGPGQFSSSLVRGQEKGGELSRLVSFLFPSKGWSYLELFGQVLCGRLKEKQTMKMVFK